MDTDFLAEIEHPITIQSATLEEEALRYFALLILYTLTVKAHKLAVKKQQGTVKVTVSTSEEKTPLSPPPEEIAEKMFEIIRAITHIDNDNGEMTLSLGLRSAQMDLQVKVKKKKDEESLKLIFPKL